MQAHNVRKNVSGRSKPDLLTAPTLAADRNDLVVIGGIETLYRRLPPQDFDFEGKPT